MKKPLTQTKVTVKLRRAAQKDRWYLIVEAYPVMQAGHLKPQRVVESVNRIITTPVWDKSTSTRSNAYKPKRDSNGVINGAANHIPGNISLSFPNADGEAILHRLDFLGICVSTCSACDSKNTQISHVLKAIDLDDSLAKGTIRISLGKNNTEREVIRIVNAIVKILS